MKRKPSHLILGALFVASTVTLLWSCGGNSNSGDLIIDGTLSNASSRAAHNVTVRDGLVGYNISALGDSDTTDVNGKFQLFGDLGHIPAQTLITFDNPMGQSSNFVLDTSGTPPFIVTFNVNADGSIDGATTTSNSPGTTTVVPTSLPTASGTEEPTSVPTTLGTSTPTTEPTSDSGGFSENADCFCNDGFGPVAPSYTCADTGGHPTNCTEPTPTP